MENTNKILAIETSGENCGVAILTAPDRFAEFNFHEKNIHSEILFELIEKLLDATGAEIKSLDAIAVSSGPGSFTGLRIGMSAAKGLALGANLPIIPVPTFDAIALKISAYVSNGKTFYVARKVNVKEHYVASYGKKNGKLDNIMPIKLMNNDELENIARNNTLFSDVNSDNSLPLPEIDARSIVNWAALFGKELLTYDYDFLEPEYFKNFIPKVKK